MKRDPNAVRKPPFDRERASRLMLEASLDALVVHSPQNVAYLTSVPPAPPLDPECITLDGRAYHCCFVVLPRDRSLSPFMTPTTGEIGHLSWHDPWITDRRAWGPPTAVEGAAGSAPIARGPIKALAAGLCERGLDRAVLGVERSFVSVRMAERFAQALPDATLADATDLLWALRQIKEPWEVDALRRAARATEAAFRSGFAAARPGMTEREMARLLENTLAEKGARGRWIDVAFGPKGTQHVGATDAALERGHLVYLHAGGEVEGYASSLSRIAVLGAPNGEMERLHAAILEAADAVRNRLHPGAIPHEIYESGLVALSRSNLNPHVPALGHGVGLGSREPPFLTPDEAHPLAEGMVLAIDVPLRAAGIGALSFGDTGVVTDRGFEPMTEPDRGLIRLPS